MHNKTEEINLECAIIIKALRMDVLNYNMNGKSAIKN